MGLAQRLKLAQGWREAGFARLRQAGTPVPLFPVLGAHSARVCGRCGIEVRSQVLTQLGPGKSPCGKLAGGVGWLERRGLVRRTRQDIRR